MIHPYNKCDDEAYMRADSIAAGNWMNAIRLGLIKQLLDYNYIIQKIRNYNDQTAMNTT